MTSTLWPTLESVPGLIASSEAWRARMGRHFECLGSFFRHHPSSTILAAPKRGEGGHHPAPSDSGLLQLDTAALGRALCTAFALTPKTAEFPLPATAQIGAWSADAVPAILTIQSAPREFRLVVAELAARLRQPFILFAPTNAHLDAACQELLANVSAGFFALDSHIQLAENGTFHPAEPPGELFARFTPQPEEPVAENVARQAFALVKALDCARTQHATRNTSKAPIYTVFRLYCMEGLTVKEVAKRCRCARSLVFTRLRALRQTLGRNPADLRQCSTHLEKIEDAMSDSRARRIYRQGVTDGGEEENAD